MKTRGEAVLERALDDAARWNEVTLWTWLGSEQSRGEGLRATHVAAARAGWTVSSEPELRLALPLGACELGRPLVVIDCGTRFGHRVLVRKCDVPLFDTYTALVTDGERAAVGGLGSWTTDTRLRRVTVNFDSTGPSWLTGAIWR